MPTCKADLDFWQQLLGFWVEDTFLPLITLNCLAVLLDALEVRGDHR